jgi:hypothetical protein
MAQSETFFRIEGVAELQEQLEAIANSYRADLVVKQTVVKAMKEALVPVASEMLHRAPYDKKNITFPHLKYSVNLDVHLTNERDKQSFFYEEGDFVTGIVSVRRSNVSLAQEFGNPRVSAHPFIRSALSNKVNVVLTIFKTQLEEILPQYWAKLNKKGIK